MRVLKGGAAASTARARSGVEAAYDHFRLERQGNLATSATLAHYDYMVAPFLRWLEAEHPDIRRVDDLDVNVVRRYRASLAAGRRRDGKPLAPRTIFDSHRVLMTFFRWARVEGYQVDPRILELKRPKVPEQEATVYHIAQVRQIIAACNPKLPQEELAVRILVGAGLRESELCGLAIMGTDGLPDLMLDSVQRGRVELRVRWDAGAKGKKSRRVPITPKLAAAIKRYEARQRPNVEYPELLINHVGRPYRRFGVDEMMDRLKERTGFRVHAHAFRHTFATVATKLGWNFEHLRAAMGHADYAVLQRYVRLATERDLGPLKEWSELIVKNPSVDV
ncbi:MAG TPA: tyrosine-type recombinase/integrase [Candidatus Dormibacteraeota bacterium]